MDNRPRLLHVSSLALSRGGIETSLLNLTKGLSSHYDMVVASGGDQSFQSKIRVAGGRTLAWEARSSLDLRALLGFLHLVEREGPTLIHIHDARAGGIGRLALATNYIPVILTAHLPSYYYHHDRFPQLWRNLHMAMETILNRFLTARVVYPSYSGYQYALKRRITPAHKAIYIPNGIEIGLFSVSTAERNAFRAQMDVRPDQPVICILGRLSVEKNISLVINAFAKLQEKDFAVCLWIAGDGPERNNLERLVRESRLSGRIRFLGGDINVALILAACDIFVLASRYEGGRTLSVMEAQVSGKPCVVSDVGDMPQMVKDGIHGFVFPEGNVEACVEALGTLLTSPTRREQMGRAGREKAMLEYGLDKMIQGYDQLYTSIIQNRASV